MFHKKFPWMNFVVFGSLALLADGLFIYTLATGQSWVPDLVAGLSTAGFNAVAAVVMLKWYLTRPDYVTRHRAAVWTGGACISKMLMDDALDFFVTEMVKYNTNPEILRSQLVNMLDGTCIEWSKKKISAIGIGWAVKDKAGLQSGKNIMVHWPGCVSDSALFHELFHEIDEIVFRISPDYAHTRANWWAWVTDLKTAYRKIELG